MSQLQLHYLTRFPENSVNIHINEYYFVDTPCLKLNLFSFLDYKEKT